MEGLTQSLEYLVEAIKSMRMEASRFIIMWYRRLKLARRLQYSAIVWQILLYRKNARLMLQSAARGFLVRKALRPLKKRSRTLLRTSPPSQAKADGLVQFNSVFPHYDHEKSLRSCGSVGALTAIDLLDQFKKPIKIEIESMPSRSLTGSLDSPSSLYADTDRTGFGLAEFGMVMRGYMAAHPVSKNSPLSHIGSADAYFIDDKLSMFGIADGVGEWERHGLDPSLFSNELMSRSHKIALSMADEISRCSPEELGNLLKQILDQAYRETEAWGSSTAVLVLVKDSKLVMTSIGDSCLLLLRPSKFNRDKMCKVFKSKEQQHFFNCPFQLSHIPQPEEYPVLERQGYAKLVNYLKQVFQSGIQQPPDSPYENAITTILELHDGDVIVAATDGLFDNLYDTDIKKVGERELKQLNTDSEFCARLAKALVVAAVDRAFNTRYLSPFAKAAKKAKSYFIGGKLDDVTVIVARACERMA